MRRDEYADAALIFCTAPGKELHWTHVTAKDIRSVDVRQRKQPARQCTQYRGRHAMRLDERPRGRAGTYCGREPRF